MELLSLRNFPVLHMLLLFTFFKEVEAVLESQVMTLQC